MSLFSELKRRNVFRVAIAYLAASWLLIEVAEEHEKVLQLICFNNPVPDDWQPLPETCEGVVEQHDP